jgi:hypothetical protein
VTEPPIIERSGKDDEVTRLLPIIETPPPIERRFGESKAPTGYPVASIEPETRPYVAKVTTLEDAWNTMLDGKVGPVVVEDVVVVTRVVVVVAAVVGVVVVIVAVVVVEDGVVITCIVAVDAVVVVDEVDVAEEEFPETTMTRPVMLGCTKQL